MASCSGIQPLENTLLSAISLKEAVRPEILINEAFLPFSRPTIGDEEITAVEQVLRIGRQTRPPLIEDAAHASGTFYKGRHVGAKGTAIFSFHAIKNMTGAEGAMFVSDDTALANRVRMLKFHGLGVDAYDRLTHGRRPQAQVMEPGFKYNLADINAAIALVQLERLDAISNAGPRRCSAACC